MEFMPARRDLPSVLEGVQDKATVMAARQQFSGNLLIARNGKTLLARSWGLANREAEIANDSETRFRIASMYKMFTAVAVLQLVDAGKLDLDGTVAAYLPDYPNRDLAAHLLGYVNIDHDGLSVERAVLIPLEAVQVGIVFEQAVQGHGGLTRRFAEALGGAAIQKMARAARSER